MAESSSFKAQERRRLRALRKEFHAQNPWADEEIGRQLLRWLLDRPGIRVVGAYSAIHSEPDIMPWIAKWQAAAAERVVALPVISDGVMRYARWQEGMEMERDRFGVLVPVSRTEERPQAIIAPCVGYSSRGLRLGYGGGWYDRFLASASPRPETVAVSYACCLSEGLGQQAHDIPFEWIVTEKGCQRAFAL